MATTATTAWQKRILTLILLLFVGLGVLYALVTPVFEASDELWHYPMIRHLADGNPLPVQVFDPAEAGPWKQEASQPPLYYYLGAALTFWIDTSDMEQVRRQNPHVDNGVITEDGNINLVVHDASLSPWQGTLLAVRIVRLASVLMGAATVFLTFLIAREVAPDRPEIALGAAAANAFIPMFLFISGAVNNDNLAIPLASLALLLLIRAVKKDSQATTLRDRAMPWLLVGVVTGLAVLTKEGTLGLLPLVWGSALVAAWHNRPLAAAVAQTGEEEQRSPLLRLLDALKGSLWRTAVVLLPVLLIAGWWYYRNIVLYGDWLGWSAFIAVLGERSQPATLAQLWSERWGFLASYWGLFGGVNVPMPAWIYTVLNSVLLLAVAGFPLYLFRTLRQWTQEYGERLQVGVAPLLQALFALVRARFALVVCLLFAAAVVVGLIRWTTTTWSSQGRLVFTAISALSILMVLGLAGWMPRRGAAVAVAGLGTFMFLISATAPLAWIAPSYRPVQTTASETMEPAAVTFGEKLQLTGYKIEPESGEQLRPGDSLTVTLAWEVLAPMERDWSFFVHLNDPVLNTPLAQRDMYPAQGLRATSQLRVGEQLVERYQMTIPETAVTPASLELVVGLYDFASREGERLLTANGHDFARLTSLALEQVPGDYPNATQVNFGNRLELAGFTIEPRRVRPGEEVTLVVYWRALEGMAGVDYTLFAQVLGEDTTRWAAADLGQPTSTWTAGEVHEITMPLQLREDTPPGVYRVIVGAYTQSVEGNFNRLQIVRDERITMDDVLLLTRLRVE